MIKFPFVVATIASMFAMSAQASDGTINFTGKIQDVTCAVTANGGTGISTVTLPTISKTALSAINSTAGDTNFNISVTGCTGAAVTGGGVAVLFEPGMNVNASGRLNNTGAATGVDLAIYRANAVTPMNLGVVPASAYLPLTGTSPAGTATLPYTVKYYATSATPGVGTVTSSVVYSVVYF